MGLTRMVGPGVQDQKSAYAASILLNSNDAIVTGGEILASVYEPGKHYLNGFSPILQGRIHSTIHLPAIVIG